MDHFVGFIIRRGKPALLVKDGQHLPGSQTCQMAVLIDHDFLRSACIKDWNPLLAALFHLIRIGQEMIETIVRLELAKVGRGLSEQDITLEATDAAVAKLSEQGFDPRFGARPVKRVIQQEVQDRFAETGVEGPASWAGDEV